MSNTLVLPAPDDFSIEHDDYIRRARNRKLLRYPYARTAYTLPNGVSVIAQYHTYRQAGWWFWEVDSCNDPARILDCFGNGPFDEEDHAHSAAAKAIDEWTRV